MYVALKTENIKSASKDYRCDACVWIVDSGLHRGRDKIFSFAEYRQIAKAKADGWKIKKGQPYIKQSGKYDGDFQTFRGRPEINAICHKYDIYMFE